MQVFYPSSSSLFEEVNMSSSFPKWYCHCKDAANGLERAALIDHPECLVYAHQDGQMWTEKVYSHACKNGNVKMIRLALQYQCPIDIATFDLGVCTNVGALIAMRTLVGCTYWDELTCLKFARTGNLKCLRYARENGCMWNDEILNEAGKFSHYHILRYAHEQGGLTFNDAFCLDVVQSARAGTTKCLMYGYKHGALMASPGAIMAAAARKFDAHFLRCLHEEIKLPWTDQVPIEAIDSGSIMCFMYAVEKGCPWNVNNCMLLVQSHIPLARETWSRSRHYKYWIENLKAILEYCEIYRRKTCKSGKCFHKKKKVAAVLCNLAKIHT